MEALEVFMFFLFGIFTAEVLVGLCIWIYRFFRAPIRTDKNR